MGFFKKILGLESTEQPETLTWIPPEDDEGKHVVRIMIGAKEIVLLLTDDEFFRAADRARRQLNEMPVEDEDNGRMEVTHGIDNRD